MYRALSRSTCLSHRCLPVSRSYRRHNEQSDFLESFIQSHNPPQTTIDHFSSISWARKILLDGAYEAVPFYSRHYFESSNENRFFAQTVNTEATIPHLLALRLKEMRTPDSATRPENKLPTPNSLDRTSSPDVICLMSLGRGLDAHPSIVHGGFQCVIFDEIMRFLILLHQNNVSKPGPRDSHYTLDMTTKYMAPVVTPCDVLVRAYLLGRDRRKWTARAEIVSGDGRVLTSAESLWLTARPNDST